MRVALGWIVGFVATIAVALLLTWAGEAIGVPSAVHLAEPIIVTSYDNDELVDSGQTSFGLAAGAASLVIGIWAGQAAFFGQWNARFTRTGWCTFAAWLMACGILMIVTALTHLAFRSAGADSARYVKMVIELGAAAGVGWACHQWWKNRTARFNDKR